MFHLLKEMHAHVVGHFYREQAKERPYDRLVQVLQLDASDVLNLTNLSQYKFIILLQ